MDIYIKLKDTPDHLYICCVEHFKIEAGFLVVHYLDTNCKPRSCFIDMSYVVYYEIICAR